MEELQRISSSIRATKLTIRMTTNLIIVGLLKSFMISDRLITKKASFELKYLILSPNV